MAAGPGHEVKSSIADKVSSLTGKNDIQTSEDITKVILQYSTRVRILLTAAIGLPNSGTTELVMGLLGHRERIKDSNGIDMYQAVLLKDSVTNKSELLDITDEEDKNEYMILFCLAKFLITKHYTFPILDQWKDGTLSLKSDNSPFSKYLEVSQYFEQLCNRLLSLLVKFENPVDPCLKMKLTRSHSFINFFDINVNKAAYEIVFILGCTYENVILINVLNLYEYTREKFNEPIKISGESEVQAHLYELHRALEYFVHHVEGTYAIQRERGNAILVGTHNKEFAANELTIRVNEISQLINHYAGLIQIDKALAFTKIIPVATRDKEKEDIEKFRKLYFQVLDKDKQFEEYVPMKFFFLRCFLHSIDKLFITREKLNEYASACGLELSEIESFLKLFRKFCSLFDLKVKEELTYIVLQPTKFVHGLDKLYIQSSIDSDSVNGILSVARARSLWDDGSHYDFYISILTAFGLMIEIESSYFLPSLRIKNDTDKPSTESDSMIIQYNVSLIPFHKQCEFVANFTKASYESITLKFKACPFYNVVKFECLKANNVIAVASVRFRSEYLEISITEASDEDICLYGLLKTCCIEVLHKLCSDYEPLRYKLAIVCPGSKESSPHFIKFNPCVPSASLTCDDCGNECNISSHRAKLWVKSAFMDNPKNAMHPRERLSVDRLVDIARKLSSRPMSDIQTLGEALSESAASHMNYRDFPSPCHEMIFSMLNNWRLKTKYPTLTLLVDILEKCGLAKDAYEYDPYRFVNIQQCH